MMGMNHTPEISPSPPVTVVQGTLVSEEKKEKVWGDLEKQFHQGLIYNVPARKGLI